ncbi:MAG TPA: hypothetical protein VMW75_02605 [Thermoanaerobaculia bacterium]|nr:hypothetical protein [Thermoanaerobaculia bacterium]
MTAHNTFTAMLAATGDVEGIAECLRAGNLAPLNLLILAAQEAIADAAEEMRLRCEAAVLGLGARRDSEGRLYDFQTIESAIVALRALKPSS